MKNGMSYYVTKIQNFFQRKKVVEKLKDDYNTSTIQSIKDEILIQMWNNGFPNEAVDLFENGELMTKEKFDQDVQTFVVLFLVTSLAFTLIKIAF
ncbi:hypothetical protein [Chishuiella sp.]|uniref:hypothetical protein n=1 Tax=Chishuiella sp. TaxID=1969467 RepID=UPI0028ACD24C|nr:hypothetical protein [Chishuiella sp.]